MRGVVVECGACGVRGVVVGCVGWQSPSARMEQLKRAGSPLVHKRVSKAPKDWTSGGPQHQTRLQRLGSDPSAVAVEGLQRNVAEVQASNDARSAAAQVERDSRVSLWRASDRRPWIALKDPASPCREPGLGLSLRCWRGLPRLLRV